MSLSEVARDLFAAIAGRVVQYDAAGHLTSDGGARSFSYNNAGRLAQAMTSGTVVASYTYNAAGQRTRKVTPQGTTVFLYDLDGHLLLEADGATGKLQVIYLYRDGTPVAQLQQPGTAANPGTTEKLVYLSTDYLGVPRRGTDAQGQEVWRWESDAFGRASPNQDPGSTGIPTMVSLRFPGQYYDAETGLDYNGYRDYDPTTGRYLEPDPISLAGGRNRYQYGFGNPMRFADPRGTNPFSGAVAGAGVGSALGPIGAVVGALAGFGAGLWLGDQAWNMIWSSANGPPAGSKPIDETPWSGDHQDIKAGVGAGAADNVKIAPNGDVWVETPDGSWENHGPAGDYTGSGKPSGRKGKDRKKPWCE